MEGGHACVTWPGSGRNGFIAPGCCMSKGVLDMLEGVSAVDRHRWRNPEVEWLRNGLLSVFGATCVEIQRDFPIWKVTDLAGF